MAEQRRAPCPGCPSRRTVLKGSTAGAALAVLQAGCGGEAVVPSGPIAAGNVSTLPLDTIRFVSGVPVLICRDSGGLYAMSGLCTHAGCLVDLGTISALFCACHGSRFDANGGVTRGPASQTLRHYLVQLDSDGTMTIDGTQPVAADVRTPLT